MSPEILCLSSAPSFENNPNLKKLILPSFFEETLQNQTKSLTMFKTHTTYLILKSFRIKRGIPSSIFHVPHDLIDNDYLRVENIHCPRLVADSDETVDQMSTHAGWYIVNGVPANARPVDCPVAEVA